VFVCCPHSVFLSLSLSFQAISGFLGLAWSGLLNPAATVAMGRQYQCSISLSNWGPNALQRHYGSLTLLDARPLLNNTYTPFPVLLASTTQGVLTLTVMGPEGAIDKPLLQQLLTEILTNIATMIGGGMISHGVDVPTVVL
jgi:hypothetical protein